MCWGKSFQVEPSGPSIAGILKICLAKQVRLWLRFLGNLAAKPVRHANALFIGEFLECYAFLLCEANVNPASSFVHGRIIGTEIKYGQVVFYS